MPSAARSGSIRSGRPVSSVIHSEGGGSASTHYAPGSHGGDSPLHLASPLPFPRPLYSADDAFVATTGGLAAPIVQRGSRRLATGGLERGRSLRRVASEADLSETAGVRESFSPDRQSAPNIADLPLTAEEARSRPGSRDFTFHGGIPPPILASPPPMYSPIRSHAPILGTIQEIISQPIATAADDVASSHAPHSSYHTAYGASTTSAYHTIPQLSSERSEAAMARVFSPAASVHTARPGETYITPAGTAAAVSSASVYTAIGGLSSNVPRVNVTEATPSGSWHTARQAEADRLSSYSVAHESFTSALATAPSTLHPSQFVTATEATFHTAQGLKLGSPFHTPETRPSSRVSTADESNSSYATAPPPVPSRDSRYSTASEGAQSLVKYQLYDRAVTSVGSEARAPTPPYASIDAGQQTFVTAHAPANHLSTADQKISTTYTSAMSHPTSGVSGYNTALHLPISRTTTRDGFDETLSFRSDEQDRAETDTHVSEPDEDLDLLADLDRRSSLGSVAVAIAKKRRAKRESHYTTGVGSARTPFGTANENTVYRTAVDSAYATAQEWQTNSTPMTTAHGSQE